MAKLFDLEHFRGVVTNAANAQTWTYREHCLCWLGERAPMMLNEIERLRDALEQIAELDGDCERQQFRLTRFQAAQVARAALAGQSATGADSGEAG